MEVTSRIRGTAYADDRAALKRFTELLKDLLDKQVWISEVTLTEEGDYRAAFRVLIVGE